MSDTNPTSSPNSASELEPTEHWVEVGAGKQIRILSSSKTGPLRRFSVDGKDWFPTVISAYQDGKAKDCVIYASDVVAQDGVQAWLVGLVVAAQKLAPGARL